MSTSLIKTTEAAEILGICTSLVRRYRREGRIRAAWGDERNTLYTPAEIERFRLQRERESARDRTPTK